MRAMVRLVRGSARWWAIRIAAVIAVASSMSALGAGHARGDGAPPEERFARAADAMAAGAHAEAVDAFLRMAEDAPAHPLADDALFSAAKLLEERLAEPARALAVYRRLVAGYPHSRTALAASRRAEAIERDLGPGGGGVDALAAFTEIVQGFSRRGEAASLAMVDDLLAAHPDWQGAARAMLWAADVHRRAGRDRQAQALYREASRRAVDEEDLFAAYRGAGDMAARQGRYDEAGAHYQRMPAGGDPARLRSLEDALAGLARDRLRARLYGLCFVVIAAMGLMLVLSLRAGAGSWRGALRALRMPPVEALFMAPIAAILAGAAYTGHELIGPAVVLVCAGGLATTWLSGAGLAASEARGMRASRPRAVMHAVATALIVVALCYIALHRNHLIDMIIETVRFGPEV